MTNVLRAEYFFPSFSRTDPYAVEIFASGSERSLKESPSFAQKSLWDSALSHRVGGHVGVGRLVFFDVAPEVVRLERAPAGEVLRVEVKDHPLAAVVGEIDRFPLVARQRERRRRRSLGRRRTALGQR